ncbi:MAG: hypothetical protein JKY65_02625 [Planctomycetes bacterium]|nr:hypothetical protein [Planctomycetota bacterium]
MTEQPSSPPQAPLGEGLADAEAEHPRTALTPLGAIAASFAILFGASAVFGLLASMGRTPPTKPFVESRAGVRVVEVGPRRVTPRVEGYGRARPARRITISADVSGRVVSIHPGLEDGRVLTGGTSVVAIDSADAVAALAQSQASLATAKAEVDRLEASRTWVSQRLRLADESLRLEEADLERARDLKTKGIENDRGLDQALHAVVRARDSRLTLLQTQALLRPQLAAARARVAEASARRDKSALDLQRCVIVLPFTGVVAKVRVEAHQRIAVGQALFELWDVERLEIPVSLSLGDALLLDPSLGATPRLGSVEIRYELPGLVQRWPGRVTRFEPLQAETQTLQAVVEVEARPGLVPQAFCHVTLEGPARELALALPLEALQEGGRVYLARRDEKGQDRLVVATIRTGQRSGSWIEVLAGLEPGARVIVSPLERAIEGLPLVVSTDTKGVSK